MRFRSLTLQNYGLFQDLKVSLDSTPGHINLLPAPNGAGKTILRSAFRDLLFGIPGQSPMNFQYGYKNMRLMAETISDEGNAVDFGRRKGAGNTLIDDAGNALEPKVLERLIGSADAPLFERLFALDTKLLREGAEAMLQSGGDIGEALFAAGSGIAAVRRIRTELEAARDQLAPSRRGKTSFYQTLDLLTKARGDLRTTAIRPQAWEDVTRNIETTRDQRRTLAAKATEMNTSIERLQRIKRVRPWLEQLAVAKRDCIGVADAPHLPADTEAHWQTAVLEDQRARYEYGRASEHLAEIQKQLAAEKLDHTLLAEAQHIDELLRELDKTDGDRRDLPKRVAERELLVARRDELLDELGDSTGEIVFPASPRMAAARDLIRRHDVLAEAVRTTQDAVAQGAVELESVNAKLGTLPEVQDTAALSALTTEARSPGEPVRLQTDLEQRLGAEETRLKAALAKVPSWHGTLEALTALVPPARPSIDRQAKAVEATTAALVDAKRDLSKLQKTRGTIDAELAKLSKGKPVPDAAAVIASRAHRDAGWSLIRQIKFDGKTAAEEVKAYAAKADLPTTYERAVESADDLVDRRDAESQRLAAIAEQQSRSVTLDAEITAAAATIADATTKVEHATQAWTALLGPLGLPETIAAGDLREFLVTREAVLDRLAARDDARATAVAETARQETLRKRFSKLMPSEECASLAEALAAAQTRINTSAAAKAGRDRLEERLDTLRNHQAKAADELRSAQAALEVWQSEWRRCLVDLRRPESDSPAAVEKAIELIEQARVAHAQLAELDHRIATMQLNIDQFEGRFRELIATIAPDLTTIPVDAAVGELRNRLAAARRVDERVSVLTEAEGTAQAVLNSAKQTNERSLAELQVLRTVVGGASDAETAERIARAKQRVEAEAIQHATEVKLLELGDGWPIETLAAEAASVQSSALDQELSRLQDEDERLGDERETAAQAEQRLLGELTSMTTSEPTLDAAERIQSATAAVTRISADALTHHAAACLLGKAIQRLRENSDDGLVPRIGRAFARITGGAYTGVIAEEDDTGRPFLVAVEADGTTMKRVEQLSEGSRDQLFLALRLVAIEDYATKAPPLPFIADDLLQTFDEERSGHTLRALVELSHHAQVIVLTHHRHVVEIARALPADEIHVCELPA